MQWQCSLVARTLFLIISLGCQEVATSQLGLWRDEDVSANKPSDNSSWGSPPMIGEYLPENTAIWDGQSGLPTWVSTSIAVLWVTMVASLPLLVLKLEHKPPTKQQCFLFGIMWFAFLGGIWLFTQIILFQSVHFKEVRSLTIIEAVYFLSQILTTVGYGDITPAKPRGQVFVGLYVLFSLFIIATVLSETADLVSYRTKQYLEQVDEAVSGGSRDRRDLESDRGLADMFPVTPPALSYKSLLKAVLAYLFFVLLGVLFFTCYPGEGKTIFQALYMSVITLSTVGFGAFTPVTEAGLVFGAFWMLFGSMALVGVVTTFTEVQDKIKASERWLPDHVEEEKKAFLSALPAEPNQFDVLKAYFLQKELLSSKEMHALEAFCGRLRPDKRGLIKRDSLENAWVHGTGEKLH